MPLERNRFSSVTCLLWSGCQACVIKRIMSSSKEEWWAKDLQTISGGQWWRPTLLPFPDGQLSLALGGRWVMMLLGVFKALIHMCVCVCCICTSALLSKLIRKEGLETQGKCTEWRHSSAQRRSWDFHEAGVEVVGTGETAGWGLYSRWPRQPLCILPTSK